MNGAERLNSVRGAIVLVDAAKGWVWILPAAKSILERMAANVDAEQPERERLSRPLQRLIIDNDSFRTSDPLAEDLWRVSIEFAT